MFDLEDQGGINIDGTCSVIDNDFRAEDQFPDAGWELDDYPDAMGTKQNVSDMLEMSSLFCAEEFFSKENAWPNLAKTISSMSTMTEPD